MFDIYFNDLVYIPRTKYQTWSSPDLNSVVVSHEIVSIYDARPGTGVHRRNLYRKDRRNRRILPLVNQPDVDFAAGAGDVWNRGHLKGWLNHVTTQEIADQSDFMTNIFVQDAQCNQGPYKEVEEDTISWILDKNNYCYFKSTEIITGLIFP